MLELECPPSGSTKYEWEKWNYYQLLGVKPPKKGSPLDSKEIKRAYRKEAQLWHPDKNINHNGAKKQKVSMEECTSRFAKIAEAYEVLSDEKKREEYRFFLEECRAESSSRWSSFRFTKFMDPMQVFFDAFFEELFKSEPEEADSEDAYSTFFEEDDFKSGKNQSKPKGKPLRSYRHEEYLKDPYTGEEIIRVMKTEEYASADSTKGGMVFFRTHAQEFDKTFDRFTGMSYSPIGEPYLLDEGYRYPSESNQGRSSKRGGGSSPIEDAKMILLPGDVLTPRSTLLVSPNERYYAGLSPECELLVMADNGNAEDDVIWSSGIPKKRMHLSSRCFATLRGPHLVVGMGRAGRNHQVLWFSEAVDYDDDENDDFDGRQRQKHSTYLAQLDNDGSLVVYKVWNVPRKHYNLAGRAWITAFNFVMGQTRAEYDEFSSPFVLTYRKCIYATGPLGCIRVARRLFELSLRIYYTIKGIMRKVDQNFDDFMELLLDTSAVLFGQ